MQRQMNASLLVVIITVACCFQASDSRPDSGSRVTTYNEKMTGRHQGTAANTSSYISLDRQDKDTITLQAASFARTRQGQLCPQRCNGTKLVFPVAHTRCLQCAPCTCDTFCDEHGTCCPPLGESWKPPALERSECRKDFDRIRIVHVVACDSQYPQDQTRSLCESKPQPRRKDTVIPVTSAASDVTYANIHCARCNYDDNTTIEWSIFCRHNQYFFHAVNDTHYEDLAIQHPEICTVSSLPVDKMNYRRCYVSFLSYSPRQILATCNLTGTWAEEDSKIREGCEKSDRSLGEVVSVRDIFYANVMCALCNEDKDKLLAEICLQQPSGPRGIFVRTTTGLLAMRSPYEEVSPAEIPKECGPGQWKNPQRGCQKLRCSAGKVLRERGRCVTAVKRVRGLGYRLTLLLRPVHLHFSSQLLKQDRPRASHIPTTSTSEIASTTSSDSDDDSHRRIYCSYGKMVQMAMEAKLVRLKLVEDRSVNVTTQPPPKGACWAKVDRLRLVALLHQANVSEDRGKINLDVAGNKQFAFLQAKIEAHIIASTEIDRDSFERDAVSVFYNETWTIAFGDYLVELEAIDLGSGFHAVGKTDDGVIMNGSGDVNRRTILYIHPSKNVLLRSLEHLFIPLDARLECLHVSFEQDEFAVKESAGNTQVSFPYYHDDEDNPIILKERSHPSAAWMTGDGRLVMCLEVVLATFPANVRVVKPSTDPTLVRQVLSMVLGSVSVVFLAVTFLTYALFSQLRSLPGLNNMGLSLSLCTAQLLLVIPWHRTPNHYACSALGVATHWAWLMALGWMAVCSQHMLSVFLSKTRHALTAREMKTVFVRHVLLTSLLSTCIVGATITASLVLTGGARIGYGGGMCFIDTGVHVLLILAFLLPLGLTVVSNLGCFFFTIAAIVRVRNLQSHARAERRGMLVYAKLVTVTGAAWLLGLLAELVNKEWMRVVAELCTAAQGLLLFMAFICNARVYRLYRERFGCLQCARDPTTSTTAVTASSSHPSHD